MSEPLTLQKLMDFPGNLQNDVRVMPYALNKELWYAMKKFNIIEGWKFLYEKLPMKEIARLLITEDYQPIPNQSSRNRIFEPFWTYRQAYPPLKTFLQWLETYYEVQKTYAEGERRQAYQQKGGDGIFVQMYQQQVQIYEKILSVFQVEPLPLDDILSASAYQMKYEEETSIWSGLYDTVDEYQRTIFPLIDQKKG